MLLEMATHEVDAQRRHTRTHRENIQGHNKDTQWKYTKIRKEYIKDTQRRKWNKIYNIDTQDGTQDDILRINMN